MSRPLAGLCLLATVVLISACGDEESPPPEPAQGPAPEASETVAEFGERFAAAGEAAAAGDCKTVDEFNAEAGFTLPCDEAGGDYGGLEVTGTADFGTAAAVDFTASGYPDGASAIAGLHEDGRYRLIQSLVPASIGLSAEQTQTELAATDQELSDQQVERFVTAVRERDCDVYFETALTPTQDKEKECRIEFDPKTGIQPDLEANPDASPEPLGGTEAFALYGLETEEYFRTLLAIRDYGPDETDPDPDDAFLVVTYRAQD